MNAMVFGQRNVAGTLSQVLEQRGIHVLDQWDGDLSAVRHQIVEHLSAYDILFLIAGDHSDETKNTLRGLRLLTDLPIVLFGIAQAPNQVLQYIRSGATDFIDVSGDFFSDLDEILQSIIARTPEVGASGQVIAVVSASGGSGATTIASNLAVRFAEMRQSTALIDLNLSGGDIAMHLGLESRHSIADCGAISGNIHAVTLNPMLEKHSSGLRVLAGPSFLGDHGVLSPDTVRSVIECLSRIHERTVMDVEDVFHREQLEAVRTADITCAVFRLDFPSLVRTRQLLDHFSVLGIENVRLIANQVVVGTSLQKSKAESVLKRPIDFQILDETRAVVDSLNMGVPLVLENRRSKFSRTIHQIADTISSEFNRETELANVSEFAV
ncbi:MAG: P-loop NTPase [Pirellulaceae bacterium]